MNIKRYNQIFESEKKSDLAKEIIEDLFMEYIDSRSISNSNIKFRAYARVDSNNQYTFSNVLRDGDYIVYTYTSEISDFVDIDEIEKDIIRPVNTNYIKIIKYNVNTSAELDNGKKVKKTFIKINFIFLAERFKLSPKIKSYVESLKNMGFIEDEDYSSYKDGLNEVRYTKSSRMKSNLKFENTIFFSFLGGIKNDVLDNKEHLGEFNRIFDRELKKVTNVITEFENNEKIRLDRDGKMFKSWEKKIENSNLFYKIELLPIKDTQSVNVKQVIYLDNHTYYREE
jgi:hypothetical protein